MNQVAGTTLNENHSHHTLIQSLLWHVLPGALTTGAFFLLRPVTSSFGFPPLFAFLLAVLLVDLPVLLGGMAYVGRQRNGGFSLSGVISFQEKVTWRRFLLVFVATFAAVFLLITALTPINTYLVETVFAGLPRWLFLEEPAQYEAYPRNVLIITFALQLIVTGIILPWVEELYFRGFLLPRLARYRNVAPLLGGLFFGLYHIWQPHGFLTVFALGVALSMVAWYTRDMRIPITLHVVANVLPRLATLLMILAPPVA